jgi:hypothetical protein
VIDPGSGNSPVSDDASAVAKLGGDLGEPEIDRELLSTSLSTDTSKMEQFRVARSDWRRMEDAQFTEVGLFATT